MKIFFDESGESGTHLLDASQPYFSLGSTNVDEAEASEILARCFPRRQGDELKSQNVLRKPTGQRGFLEFAKEVGKQPERFCAVKIGKRFAVISKMVDNLVEPLLSAQGYDFYSGNYAMRFANSANFVFDQLLERPVAENLMRLYNEFARRPDHEKLRELQTALETASRNPPYGSAVTLDLLRDGAHHFEALHGFDDFEDSNEIHVTAVISCMGHWQGLHTGTFEVVHDESIHFFRRSARWATMTDPSLEPLTLSLGEKSLRLPISVASTTSARSHESASLQLCDLLAGFVSRASAPNRRDEFATFVSAAIDAGVGEVKVFPVDAGTDFAEGPPARAAGPDIVDRIAMAVGSRANG